VLKRRHRKGPSHPWNLLRLVIHPRRGSSISDRRRVHNNNTPGATGKEMASSSGNKPTMEERIKSLEEGLQHLKHLLHNQLDFLHNLDIDARRRLEVLEVDIASTKFGLSEEIGKLHKAFKDPKQELEDRVSHLEEKMEQLNKDWKQERDLSKGGGSKKSSQ